MSFAGKKGVEKAFAMLRTLPRVCLANIRRNPGTRIKVNNTNDYSVLWVGSYQSMMHKNPEERTLTPPRMPESRISVMFESVHVTVLGQHVERNTL
jgi:hypothetical protein